MTPKFLEHMVILCLERRHPKQNSVIHLKSTILLPPNFWAGYASDKSARTASLSNTYILLKLFCGLWCMHRNYRRFEMQRKLLQAFVFSFRCLRSMQLSYVSSSKWEHRSIAEECNLTR